MKILAALIPALFLVACASNSGKSSSSKSHTLQGKTYETEADARQASDRDDLICTYEKAVGSHMKKAICMSKSERESNAEKSQEAARRAQRNRSQGSEGKGG